MKNYFKTSAFVIILAFTFSSCKKKDVQPTTPLKSEIAVKIKPGNLVSQIVGAAGTKEVASINWTTYNFPLKGVSFIGAKDDSTIPAIALLTKEFQFESNSKANLLATFPIEVGNYSKTGYMLDIKGRTGNYLEISGVCDVNDLVHPIKFICKEEIVTLAACEDKILKSGEKYSGDIVIDFDKLGTNITPLDLINVTYSANNSILIDENNNPALYAKLKANLSAIAHFSYN